MRTRLRAAKSIGVVQDHRASLRPALYQPPAELDRVNIYARDPKNDPFLIELVRQQFGDHSWRWSVQPLPSVMPCTQADEILVAIRSTRRQRHNVMHMHITRGPAPRPAAHTDAVAVRMPLRNALNPLDSHRLAVFKSDVDCDLSSGHDYFSFCSISGVVILDTSTRGSDTLSRCCRTRAEA